MTTSAAAPNHREAPESFLRCVTFPEEDRYLFTTASWDGGYRWFRSANVIDLEAYRNRRLQAYEVG
jgi:hypothetical protein